MLSDNWQLFPRAGPSTRSLPPSAWRDSAWLHRAAADGGADTEGLHVVALGRGAWVAVDVMKML